MSKKLKIIVNIALVLILFSCLAWGTVVRELGSWGSRANSTWWNDDIFWANVCQIIIPIIIIILLVFFNRKK